MIKEAFFRSLMSGKSFVDEIHNEIFMGGEPTPPPWWEEYGVKAEYVVADGVTNYINTLLQIQKNITIELDVEYLSVSNKERSLFGAANTNASPRAVVEAGSITSGGKFFYGYSSNWHVVYDEIPVAHRHYKLKYVLKDTEQVMYIDGVEVHRIADPKPGVPNALMMYLFARNINGTANNFVTAKLYGAKVSNTEGILLDYMPLYVSEKSITDVNGTEYPIGSYILVDNVTKKATILNGKPLVGSLTKSTEQEKAVVQNLMKIGVQPTVDSTANTKMLNEMGVSL